MILKSKATLASCFSQFLFKSVSFSNVVNKLVNSRCMIACALEAWFMDDESNEDQRLPHHRNPKEFVSLDHLVELGVLYSRLNPNDYENDEELQKIREERGYNYMDLHDLCPEKVANYEEKWRTFYTEHIHEDEEIRCCLEESGYFDVRGKDDQWI